MTEQLQPETDFHPFAASHNTSGDKKFCL